jgi:hypothetical protein
MPKKWFAVATLLALAGCDSYVGTLPGLADALSGEWLYTASEVRSESREGACALGEMKVRMTQEGPKLLGDTDPAPLVCATPAGTVSSTFPASVFRGEMAGDSVRFTIGDSLYCRGRVVSATRMEGVVSGYGPGEEEDDDAVPGSFVLVRASP